MRLLNFLTIINNIFLQNFSCECNSFNRGYSCIKFILMELHYVVGLIWLERYFKFSKNLHIKKD